MPKRSRVKSETAESNALKKMRTIKGLSQRKAGMLIGVPPTKVNHTENGRAYIEKSYIEKFIKGLGYSWEEWLEFVSGKGSKSSLKEQCILLIRGLDDQKLGLVFNLLTSLK
ncbi:MAG: helix-turn-helix transcriptional regulator [Bacteriovoracaceae bacterium]|jgi:transcriptional regulator with XRE-family HTH domain|nr:helix-turn-helix transcriptional regulator [Bacteriovoracaceae bacterium]